MLETANFKQALLEILRSLSQDQQKTVLSFARSLRAKSTQQSLNLSLQQIAKLSITELHRLIAAYIPDTAQDFLTDPELGCDLNLILSGRNRITILIELVPELSPTSGR